MILEHVALEQMTLEQLVREPMAWMTAFFAVWAVVLFCGFWFKRRR